MRIPVAPVTAVQSLLPTRNATQRTSVVLQDVVAAGVLPSVSWQLPIRTTCVALLFQEVLQRVVITAVKPRRIVIHVRASGVGLALKQQAKSLAQQLKVFLKLLQALLQVFAAMQAHHQQTPAEPATQRPLKLEKMQARQKLAGQREAHGVALVVQRLTTKVFTAFILKAPSVHSPRKNVLAHAKEIGAYSTTRLQLL